MIHLTPLGSNPMQLPSDSFTMLTRQQQEKITLLENTVTILLNALEIQTHIATQQNDLIHFQAAMITNLSQQHLHRGRCMERSPNQPEIPVHLEQWNHSIQELQPPVATLISKIWSLHNEKNGTPNLPARTISQENNNRPLLFLSQLGILSNDLSILDPNEDRTVVRKTLKHLASKLRYLKTQGLQKFDITLQNEDLTLIRHISTKIQQLRERLLPLHPCLKPQL